MIKHGLYKVIAGGVCAVILGSSAFAGFWDLSTPYKGPKKDILTLVITANYKKPVILAELIQRENNQPFILLPAQGQEELFKDSVYFCPGPARKTALEVKEKNLSRFIKFLNPRQIIVLGDSRYVPPKYLAMLDKRISIIIIKNDDWIYTSETLGKLLDLNNLASDYKRLYQKLMGGQLYVPTAPRKTEAVENVTEIKNDNAAAEGKNTDDEAAAVQNESKDAKPQDKADVKDAVAEPPAAEAKKSNAVKDSEAALPKGGPVLIKD